MRLFLLALLVVCACATPQYTKSVKGGYGGQTHQYRAGDNLIRYYNSTSQGYGGRNVLTETVNIERGVCYTEVPTASLVRDPNHVPTGNGSRSDLSRIRTCCKGYIRNIHNYKLCDPVCTKECVNALCTAPETCTCYPDHVRNLAGVCIPTCPIGCQNGNCAGGECICKSGYKLDSESRFCIPYCRDNCGGFGNCTAPNVCECRSGYKMGSAGSCVPACDRCTGAGQCVAPNDCRCPGGYTKNTHGDCEPQCTNDCKPNGICVAPNVCNNGTTTPHSTYNQTPQRPAGSYPNYQPNFYPYPTRAPQYPDQQGTYTGPNYPGNYPSFQPSNYTDHTLTNSSGSQVFSGQQNSSYYGHRPEYPGQQSHYPGHQPSHYPDNQPPNYPGQQPPSNNQQYPYPNYQPSQYPSNPSSNYTGHQPSYYPGQQPPTYPGNQPSNYPGQQPHYPSNPPSNYTSHQPSSYPGNQPSNYPSQKPYNSDNQPNYYPTYTDSQQPNHRTPYSDNQYKPQPDNENPNLNHSDVNSGYYPTSQQYPVRRGYPSNYYPNQQQNPSYPGETYPNQPAPDSEIYSLNSGVERPYGQQHTKGQHANIQYVPRKGRSVNTIEEKPVDVAELLTFEIADDI